MAARLGAKTARVAWPCCSFRALEVTPRCASTSRGSACACAWRRPHTFGRRTRSRQARSSWWSRPRVRRRFAPAARAAVLCYRSRCPRWCWLEAHGAHCAWPRRSARLSRRGCTWPRTMDWAPTSARPARSKRPVSAQPSVRPPAARAPRPPAQGGSLGPGGEEPSLCGCRREVAAVAAVAALCCLPTRPGSPIPPALTPRSGGPRGAIRGAGRDAAWRAGGGRAGRRACRPPAARRRPFPRPRPFRRGLHYRGATLASYT